MQAVNLIPTEERRGAGGAGGRSGGAAQGLLVLLALLVAVVSFLTLQKRSIAETRAMVATVEQQAAAVEGKAAALSSFTQFATLRATRTETVRSLAQSRFDWSHAMGELARVIPADVWLTGLQGTVAPGVSLKTSTVSLTSALRSALSVPTVEMSGCTTNQVSVARMITRMRLIDGVTRVSLHSSVKPSTGGAGGAGGGACKEGDDRYPQFALVVFFDQAVGSVPTTAPGAREIAATRGTTGPTGPAGAAPAAGATP